MNFAIQSLKKKKKAKQRGITSAALDGLQCVSILGILFFLLFVFSVLRFNKKKYGGYDGNIKIDQSSSSAKVAKEKGLNL